MEKKQLLSPASVSMNKFLRFLKFTKGVILVLQPLKKGKEPLFKWTL
jgi:hypothetical protein